VPLVFPTPPGIDEAFLGRRLGQIAASTLSGAPGQIAGVEVRKLSYTSPHQYWYSTDDAVITNRLLADAIAISWRYLLCEGRIGVGEIEITLGTTPQALPGIAVHAGPAAQLSIEALAAAETLAEVRNETVEPRFLRITSLHFAAIWLHREGYDRLIPISAVQPALASLQDYTEAEVRRALLARATRTDEFIARRR
jgi:hypothetical protein